MARAFGGAQVGHCLPDTEPWYPYPASRTPYPLSCIRALLLRVSADAHILLVTVHHIAADAWSLAVVTHEVATIYNALANEVEGAGIQSGDEPETLLPALPVQYRDFAVWQRQWLQGTLLEREIG